MARGLRFKRMLVFCLPKITPLVIWIPVGTGLPVLVKSSLEFGLMGPEGAGSKKPKDTVFRAAKAYSGSDFRGAVQTEAGTAQPGQT